jgi:hypothetical protein
VASFARSAAGHRITRTLAVSSRSCSWVSRARTRNASYARLPRPRARAAQPDRREAGLHRVAQPSPSSLAASALVGQRGFIFGAIRWRRA